MTNEEKYKKALKKISELTDRTEKMTEDQYIGCVTQGNADDTFSDGVEEGEFRAAQIARQALKE